MLFRSKAQNSAEYQDYLSRCGEDNEHYYSIKIQATQLLMDNVDRTFVTPVFNGSTSLRNAAGQLIENVNKGVRRKKEFTPENMHELYEEVSALYRLDQIETTSGKRSFGPLPFESKLLLGALGLCWLGMGVYVISDKLKKKKS